MDNEHNDLIIPHEPEWDTIRGHMECRVCGFLPNTPEDHLQHI